ncbi:MAG: hypothetical protein ACHRXM_17150 [Isosphaerales bacterium]
MSKTDADLSLESDGLEEQLEAATPAQPVVVIQYRNRGVPSWVFFPLMLLITLGAILIYHRLVVERYRVQAAVESRQVLENWIGAPRSSRSLPVGERPLAVAASSQPDVPAHGRSGPSESAPNPATEAPAPAPAPAQTAAVSAPATVTAEPQPRLRTILPNPSAAVGPPAAPSTGQEGTGLVALGGTTSTPAGVPSSMPAKDRAPANRDTEVVAPALQPLPSKEESERQIKEEAAKKEADLVAREQNREADLRARRYEERAKFREELREVLRLHGSEAGPEIDKLSRRYGFDANAEKYDLAERTWRTAKMNVPSKVKRLRSLEVPEAVILDFLSNDQNLLRRSPKGPRNANEVRIRAARQLLGFPLPAGNPALRLDPGAGQRPR